MLYSPSNKKYIEKSNIRLYFTQFTATRKEHGLTKTYKSKFLKSTLQILWYKSYFTLTDTGCVTLSQYILLDPILMCFIMASFYVVIYRYRVPNFIPVHTPRSYFDVPHCGFIWNVTDRYRVRDFIPVLTARSYFDVLHYGFILCCHLQIQGAWLYPSTYF